MYVNTHQARRGAAGAEGTLSEVTELGGQRGLGFPAREGKAPQTR